jgi:pyruvate,water dikinase
MRFVVPRSDLGRDDVTTAGGKAANPGEPVSGDRETIVVDASSGLGEAVVSGPVTPDHYAIDGRGLIRDYRPGRREVIVSSVPGGGVAHQQGEPDHIERLLDGAGRSGRLGIEVATHFGRPQDIEWAYAEGRVWLLQARPMTALPPPPLNLNAVQRRLGSYRSRAGTNFRVGLASS